MTITPTQLEGCFVISPRIFNDDRGYFFESYNTKSFNDAAGAEIDFVQDNQAGVFLIEHAFGLSAQPNRKRDGQNVSPRQFSLTLYDTIYVMTACHQPNAVT